MTLIKIPTQDELISAVLGSIVSGAVIGIVLQASANAGQPGAIDSLIEVVKAGGGTYLVGSIILGVGFAVVATYLTDRYVAFVLSLTSQYETIRKAVMPLTEWLGMQMVVISTIGILYGLAVGVMLSLAPILLQIKSDVLHLQYYTLLPEFILYGLSLGVLHAIQSGN